jgi:hypothetical protein
MIPPMKDCGARTLQSSRFPAHEFMRRDACVRRLLLATALLLALSVGRIPSVGAQLLASPGMDYAFAVTILGVCAVATLLVVFDEAGRAQRTRLRLRRAWHLGLRRAQRRLVLVVTLLLARVVRRRVRLHATLPAPQATVSGRPVPSLALCRRLQRGQRPRVPAAGGRFHGRC